MLVNNAYLLKKAFEEKYAVGAFNANNLEQIQAIVAAAEEENSPIILQASQGAISYSEQDTISARNPMPEVVQETKTEDGSSE